MATELLFSTDAYLRTFQSDVAEIDEQRRRVALRRTVFYPGGGGQPHDVGVLQWDGGRADVVAANREGPYVWHQLADDAPVPDPGAEVQGEIDWDRRHLLMRTH